MNPTSGFAENAFQSLLQDQFSTAQVLGQWQSDSYLGMG
jgi:hypothetical protein